MRHPVTKGEIVFLMTDGEVEADRVSIVFHPFGNDVIDRVAEILSRVIGLYLEAADDETGKVLQLTGPLQMPEHAVDAVEVFAGILNEQDLSGGIDVRGGAGQCFDGLEVTTDERAGGRSLSVQRVRRCVVLHLFAGECRADGQDRLGLYGFSL